MHAVPASSKVAVSARHLASDHDQLPNWQQLEAARGVLGVAGEKVGSRHRVCRFVQRTILLHLTGGFTTGYIYGERPIGYEGVEGWQGRQSRHHIIPRGPGRDAARLHG